MEAVLRRGCTSSGEDGGTLLFPAGVAITPPPLTSFPRQDLGFSGRMNLASSAPLGRDAPLSPSVSTFFCFDAFPCTRPPAIPPARLCLTGSSNGERWMEAFMEEGATWGPTRAPKAASRLNGLSQSVAGWPRLLSFPVLE